MAETVAASAIILEVLNKHNYKDWRIRLQTYLKAQDLWDVVEDNDEASKEGESEAEIKAWKKKKAAALHTIYISCGRHAFKTIRKIKSAKKAWKELEKKFKPPGKPKGFPHKPFFDAVKKNNWSIAESFLSNEATIRSKHPVSGQTALHIAAFFGCEKTAKELVERMQKEDLEIQDTDGYTALLVAIRRGKTDIVKSMIEKNKEILRITQKGNSFLPVGSAFTYGKIELGRYLYFITRKEYFITPKEYPSAKEGFSAVSLLADSLQAEQYDIALDLLEIFSRLPIFKSMLEDDERIPLILGEMLATFPTERRLNFWQQRIYDGINIPPIDLPPADSRVDVFNSEDGQITCGNITCSGLLKQFSSNACELLGLLSATLKTFLGINHLYKMKLVQTCSDKVLQRICEEIKSVDDEELKANPRFSNTMKDVIANGLVEFVVKLTESEPRVLLIHDKETDRNMISIAIQYRQEKITSKFMDKIVQGEELSTFLSTDKFGNSQLHMTGLLPPSSRLNITPGPALQLQKELQWFQEVKKVVSLIESKSLMSMRNEDGMTAQESFTENHEKLRKEGEKWMKETASSYSFVAALIVTIMFAAGFIVPGGGNDMRSLSHEKWFLVFLTSDAISLFSSTTSVIMFLGILTSRYYEEAFLKSLPTKLILGMSALFFSIATMMLCFCTALYEMLQGRLEILIPIILLASVPVYLFISLQFPLLVHITISTYGSGLGIAPKKEKKRSFFSSLKMKKPSKPNPLFSPHS